MNKNIRVIYKRLTDNFIQNGYINLNHRPINTKDNLVEICSIFRNPKYETFRMIYVKDNKIVGYESISSKCPSAVNIFRNRRKDNGNHEKCYYKMKNRMNRLQADGYYMVHNHPSGNAIASMIDIRVTKQFVENLKGFKGHLILGHDSYSWISEDNKKENGLKTENTIPINLKKSDKMAKILNKKSIYDIPILNRSVLVSIMKNIVQTNDYSTAILTDARGKVRMILDIPNNMLNQSKENLNGFFKNLARESGAINVFFGTSDNDTFKKSISHAEYGTFRDSVCFKEVENNHLEVYEKLETNETKELFEAEKLPSPNLLVTTMSIEENRLKFDDERRIKINMDEDNYISIPCNRLEEKYLDIEDKEEPKKGQIKVLFKRVGKPAIVKLIPNTLEAKQKLVGGLIEVIPYDDETLIVCNEEGKILGLKPNLIFDFDYIAGDCFLIGDDYQKGDFKSLSDEQIEKAKIDFERRSFIDQTSRDCSRQYEDMEL